MSKAQADIISAVIIVLLAISLTSAAFMWGWPLIVKKQDTAMVARVTNAFNQELTSKIEDMANTGGSVKFTLENPKGLWSLDESDHTLSFTFFSTVSNRILDQWVGEGCNPDPDGPGFVDTPGKFGIDKPSVICVLTNHWEKGFNITYKIGYRQLSNIDGTKIYKIELVRPVGGVPSSAQNSILISRGSIDQIPTADQKTLIITKIEILL